MDSMGNDNSWAWPFLCAVIADLMLPFGLLSKLSLVVVFMPSASCSIRDAFLVSWAAGFIDLLYVPLDREYDVSVRRVGIYIGTLLVRRLVRLLQPLAGWAFSPALNHPLALLALGIIIAACLHYQPARIKRVFKVVSESLVYWPVVVLTAAVYLSLRTAGSAWHLTNSLVAQSNGVFWAWFGPLLTKWGYAPQLAVFGYSSLPAPSLDAATGIRLLKLHRRFPFLQLSAELVSFPRQSAPAYHAISYVWSHGPQDWRPMMLNGQQFRVRGNVHDILVNCGSFLGPRLVWIDTICIDQSNAREKTLQVRAMQDIYARAAHVLICLGGGGASALHLRSLLLELQAVRRLWGRDYLIGHTAGFRLRRARDPLLRARVRAVLDLMRHPWFARVWVVQEAVVARRATFFYGGMLISSRTLHDWQGTLCDDGVFQQLASLEMSSPADVIPDLAMYLGFLSFSFILTYQNEYENFGPRPLSHVLRVFRDKVATQPVDKVFALIGLAEDRADTRLQRLIDYRRTLDDVLLDVASYLVDIGQALDVLDLAGLRQNDAGRSRLSPLPSWAVDWSASRVSASLNPTASGSYLRYHATSFGQKEPAEARRGSSRRELVVRGQRLDRIVRLVPSPWTRPVADPSASMPQYLAGAYPDEALALARAQGVPDPYTHYGRDKQQRQPLEEAVWRTLIGDRTSSARPAPASYGMTVRTAAKLLRYMGKEVGLDSILAASTPPEEMRRELGVTPEEQLEIRRAQAGFNEIDLLFDKGKDSSTFVFCVTELGFIGMIPDVSEAGDEVCLIYGVPVPCVLRRLAAEKGGGTAENHYQLVGDAYVHGIMDGEALNPASACDFVLV